MVTHDPRAARRAERILHLEKGQLVRETTSHFCELQECRS